VRLSELEINPAVELVQIVIYIPRFRLRIENRVRRADLPLGIVDSTKCPSRQKRKNRGPDARDFVARHKHRPSKDVGVHLVEHRITLWNAAAINHTLRRSAMLAEPVKDDSRMKGGALDGSEQFILRGVL